MRTADCELRTCSQMPAPGGGPSRHSDGRWGGRCTGCSQRRRVQVRVRGSSRRENWGNSDMTGSSFGLALVMTSACSRPGRGRVAGTADDGAARRRASRPMVSSPGAMALGICDCEPRSFRRAGVRSGWRCLRAAAGRAASIRQNCRTVSDVGTHHGQGFVRTVLSLAQFGDCGWR